MQSPLGRHSAPLRLGEAVALIANARRLQGAAVGGPPGWSTLWEGVSAPLCDGRRVSCAHDKATPAPDRAGGVVKERDMGAIEVKDRSWMTEERSQHCWASLNGQKKPPPEGALHDPPLRLGGERLEAPDAFGLAPRRSRGREVGTSAEIVQRGPARRAPREGMLAEERSSAPSSLDVRGTGNAPPARTPREKGLEGRAF